MKKCSAPDCEKPLHAHGYCSMHAQRMRRRGRIDLVRTFSKEYFEEHVSKDIGDCWIWMGTILSTGYGQFFQKLAHRVAHELYIGKIPEGKIVLHSCDNKLCVNPRHLSAGTHQDNSDDMMKKGRHWAVPVGKGCDNPLSKFKPEDVDEIRRLYAAGAKMRAIGRQFKVHHKTISGVVHGRRYIVMTRAEHPHP